MIRISRYSIILYCVFTLFVQKVSRVRNTGVPLLNPVQPHICLTHSNEWRPNYACGQGMPTGVEAVNITEYSTQYTLSFQTEDAVNAFPNVSPKLPDLVMVGSGCFLLLIISAGKFLMKMLRFQNIQVVQQD